MVVEQFGLGIAKKERGSWGQNFGWGQVEQYLHGQYTAFLYVYTSFWAERTACSAASTYLSFPDQSHVQRL
jgi:hypothetical protein